MSRLSASSWWAVVGLVSVLSCLRADAVAAEPFAMANLDFEDGASGWAYHVGERGVALKAVAERTDVADLDDAMVVAGAAPDQSAALVLKPMSSKAPVVAFQCGDARDLRGDLLLVRADMREDGAEGALFVVESRRKMLMGQAISSRTKTMGDYLLPAMWSEVSSAASEVCVGFMAWGTGTVTFDNLVFSTDDPERFTNELRAMANRDEESEDQDAAEASEPSYALVEIATGTVEVDLEVITKSKSAKARYKGQLKQFSESQEVAAFMMGTHEVTRALWAEVMEESPWDRTEMCIIYGADDDTRPVECISLIEALVFANRLSIRDGLEPVYSSADDAFADVDDYASGYRLPSASEWLLALGEGRGEKSGVSGDVCASANVFDRARQQDRESKPDHGFACDDGQVDSQPVGERAANENGMFDIQGNVREWLWTENDDGDALIRTTAGLSYRSTTKSHALVRLGSARREGMGLRLARRIPVEADDIAQEAAADEATSEDDGADEASEDADEASEDADEASEDADEASEDAE
jgi:formylglycine-generating enzyme required for sulfatase activity